MSLPSPGQRYLWRELLLELKRRDKPLHAALVDASLLSAGQGLVLAVPAGFDFHLKLVSLGKPTLLAAARSVFGSQVEDVRCEMAPPAWRRLPPRDISTGLW